MLNVGCGVVKPVNFQLSRAFTSAPATPKVADSTKVEAPKVDGRPKVDAPKFDSLPKVEAPKV